MDTSGGGERECVGWDFNSFVSVGPMTMFSSFAVADVIVLKELFLSMRVDRNARCTVSKLVLESGGELDFFPIWFARREEIETLV